MSPGAAETGDDNYNDGYIAWIDDYDSSSGVSDLPGCETSGNGALNELGDEGWDKSGWDNTWADEDHWRDSDYRSGGLDDSYADLTDIAYFCGHGGRTSTYGYVYFWAQGSSEGFFKPWETNDATPDYDLGGYGEHGQTGPDIEWFVLDTGETLPYAAEYTADWYKWPFSQVHVLLGWEDIPTDNDHGGEFFDSLFDTGSLDGGGKQIWDAWNEGNGGGCDGQPSGTTQTAVAEDSYFLSDYMHGESSGPSSDAGHDGTYWRQTYNC